MSKVTIRPQLLGDIFNARTNIDDLNPWNEINIGYPNFSDPSHIDSLKPEGRLVMIKRANPTDRQGRIGQA